MLVIATPLAFGRVLCERVLALRLLAGASVLHCTGAIALTFSRGGFLGLAVVLVLCLFRWRPAVAALALAGATVALVVGPAAGSYESRLGTLSQALPWHSASKSTDPSIQGRAAFFHAGVQIWRDHPLGGVGYANFPLSYREYNRRVGTDPTLGSTPHDTPLEILSETGVVGLALWLVLVVAAFTTLGRARAWAGRADVRSTVDFLAIALVGYLVTGLFIGGAYPMLAWLLLAACFSVRGALGAGDRPVIEELRVGPRAR